jgi:hypothetical protein
MDRRGLTVVEIIIAMGLFAFIAATGIIMLNPGGQLAKGRNTQRELHLNGILNGIRQNMADTSGASFTCASGAIPTSTKRMGSASGSYDIAPCLVPTYIPTMPTDPSASGAHYTDNTDYDTGYYISRNASSGQITLTAPSAELGKTISVLR